MAAVGIVDYNSGNLLSVQNTLQALGAAPQLLHSPGDFAQVDRLVLPGVGAFGDCVRNLRESGLWDGVKEWLASGRPFFGICVGYQLLFERSEESPEVEGLAHYRGIVKRFPRGSLKVPHMGWNVARPVSTSAAAWAALPEDPHFYFVHSYYPEPEDPALVAAWTDYGVRFASALQDGPLFATQFHPEKSQDNGLQLLRNFLKT
ncbi:MAG: imidazole glycerol phosphate synthase subunit HisH [Verrucomicrobiota bacterium]